MLACVLHAGDRFRCWKRILRGMKFSVITIYHTVGLGCEETLLYFFFFLSSQRRKLFSPRARRVGVCLVQGVSTECPCKLQLREGR